MANILILGAGMMGSALAYPIADAGHHVRLCGTPLDEEIIAQAKKDGTHPKLGLKLPGGVTPFAIGELSAAAQDIDAIALGVSSAGIDWASTILPSIARPGLPLFMITKGLVLDDGALRTLPDVVKARLPNGGDGIWPAAIAGPCIAGELARRVPTCVVLAGHETATLEAIQALIETPYYRLFPTTDVVGAEVSAALKNAYAMGIAFAVGKNEKAGGTAGSIAMHNLESAIMAQAIVEMSRIADRLGGSRNTVTSLAGVGDLDVTTNGGRTGRFGKFLGMGLSRDEAIQKMEGATLECLEILAVMRQAVTVGSVPKTTFADLPLLEHLIHVALDGAPADPPIDKFFGRGA